MLRKMLSGFLDSNVMVDTKATNIVLKILYYIIKVLLWGS